MAVIQTGGSVAGVANVDSYFNLNVAGPKNILATGFYGLAGINDDGTIVAGGRINRAYMAEGGALYAGNKRLLWDDTFNATAQNTSKYKFSATTMTGAMAGGFLTLNSGSITTVSTSCGFQTFKQFPLFAKAELRANFSVQIPNGAQANQTIEFGLFQAALNGAAPGAPTDGVLFRYDPTGGLRGVINYNGTETQTGTITPPSTNTNHDYLIVTNSDAALFYIDGILQGIITLLTAAPTQGQPFQAASQPATWRVYTAGSAPALAPILKCSDVYVSELGPDNQAPWSQQKSGFGHMGYQGQNGGTMGSTSNFGNGALAAASILSNTNVGTGNPAGLGGYSHDLCTLAAGTDGIVTSFQNPAAAAGVTGRNLVITGVWIHSVVDTVIVGGPLAFVYTLAYGHTAISLATTETSSFTSGTTKAPRRIAIGCEGMAAAAAAGTLLSQAGVYRQFISPITVAPGEFVAVVGRNFGTAVTSGSVVHAVGFDAYFE